MNQFKYACPYCGQHIEYTDGYAGRQMPCPMCQHAIVFPAIPGKMTSKLRLVRDIPRAAEASRFNFANFFLFLREFKHWKVVGMCLAPFVILAGALVAASVARQHEPVQDVAPAVVAADPQALHKLTDLTRADMQVQDHVKAVNNAYAIWDAAEHRRAALARRAHESAPTLKAADDDAQHAQSVLTAARKSFDKCFADYQKLGGTVDYHLQLP